ncbi:hypothetical protein KSF_015810 [Reticulibacter mediterranei]|uniref:Uncharacterized protein n=1 Tax=Reticulibacter mediterranei TaxID=2778369 RepID=A0A8J3IDK2_9CHLR|nr:helix-turn-helix domain-containing protein [Reticulibacter mediterranei]GHO91533.1 hypothetical protein KSF_015810 [Reticulibacter mediterranei]
MAAAQQQPAKRRFWRGVVSLKPLKKHIDWWLRIMAILAVPLIIGCTIVIGAELAAPDWFEKETLGKQLATLTEDLLNAAIEGSMLGCIALAKQARRDGKTSQANMMRNLGWLFAVLTVVTVGFRVFHVPKEAGEVLLWVRCAAGIVFCYLSHMNDDEEDGEEITPQQHRSQMEELAATFSKQLQEMTQALHQKADTLTKALEEIQQLKAAMSSRIRTATNNEAMTDRTADIKSVGQTSAPERTATTSAIGQESEQAQGNESANNRTATTKAERTPDKLELTLNFLRENLQRASSPDIDTLLAAHLGLNRPASARFWRLKAQELLDATSDKNNGEHGAFAGVLAYVQTHEPITQKAVAVHLGITERTVRRHFAALRASGQLPLTWTHDEEDNNQRGGQERTAQPIGQPTPESVLSNERTEDNEEQDSEAPINNVVLFRHAAQ